MQVLWDDSQDRLTSLVSICATDKFEDKIAKPNLLMKPKPTNEKLNIANPKPGQTDELGQKKFQ